MTSRQNQCHQQLGRDTALIGGFREGDYQLHGYDIDGKPCAPIGMSFATLLMGFLAATSAVVHVDSAIIGVIGRRRRRRRRLETPNTASQAVSSVTGNVCVAEPSDSCDFGPSKPTQTSPKTIADAVLDLLSFLQEKDMSQYGVTKSDGNVWTIEKGRELLESLCHRDNRNVEEVVGAMEALEFVTSDGTNGGCVTIGESGELTLHSTTCINMEKILAYDVTKSQVSKGVIVGYGVLLFATIAAWARLVVKGY